MSRPPARRGQGASPGVPGARVRAEAARVLDAVLADGRSLGAVLAPALPALDDPRDRALLEALCFEVLRHRRRYEAVRALLLDRPLPGSARPVPMLLLVGLAQLDGLQMAPYAAISATAEAARTLGKPHLVGLVNALLRRFDRERPALDAAARAAAPQDHPDWLLQALRADWPQQADAVLAANDCPAPLWLRVNCRRASRADYQAMLASEGIDAEAPEALPDALRLSAPLSPTTLPGWDQGLASVQDAAAQLAVGVLEPAQGNRVLDACAAPGGKAAHLLERADALELLAIDQDPARLRRVAATLDRLGLAARLRAADAGDAASWWDGRPFDRILLDAPCSGTGVIRRHPDIKWHRRAADIAPLVALQARLLDALWPMLAAGGRLVYATCSLLKDENERQIDAFLARHGDAHALPLALPHGRASGPGWQVLPGEGDLDGFFYAALARR